MPKAEAETFLRERNHLKEYLKRFTVRRISPRRLSIAALLTLLVVPVFLFGSGEKIKITSLEDLIRRYDSSACKECHAPIYAQWEKSHHARSLMGLDDWIFMSKYLKEGPLAVKSPQKATMANFPCAKCHLPQLFQAGDAVAAELASAILRDDKKRVRNLNIGCLVCHQDKAVVHGRPEKKVLYGNQEVSGHPEPLETVKRSPLLKNALFCGQCHGLGPNLEFETPVQCGTLYGSYLHAYIPAGGTQTCQECHMPNKDHTCLPDFNNRVETSARLKRALPMEVQTLGYVFQPNDNRFIPTAVVKTKISNKAGHRIPDG
jgi:hypothetical protein